MTDLFAADEAARWEDLFERADWTAPYDCGVGPAGTVVRGYRCPECHLVEPGVFQMSHKHGLDPTVPRVDDPDEPWCRYLSFQRERVAMGLPWIRLPHDHHPRPGAAS